MSKEGLEAVVQALSDLVKLVVGAVALVYVAGGAVLWVRLRQQGVPTDPIVSALPRELLLTVGLRSVVVPAALLAPVALVMVWPRHAALRVAVAIGVLVVAVIGSLGPVERSAWIFGIVVGLLVTTASSLVVGRALRRWQSMRGTTVLVLAVVAASLGGSAARVYVEARDPSLDGATVCPNDTPEPYTGDYIGETDKVVYVATQKQVLSIPKERVAELWIGKSDGSECRFEFTGPPAATPPSPPAG